MSTDDTVTDLRRELEKARDALAACQVHLARHAEANAALHCCVDVFYSPLHAKVAAAITGVDHALKRTNVPPPGANPAGARSASRYTTPEDAAEQARGARRVMDQFRDLAGGESSA